MRHALATVTRHRRVKGLFVATVGLVLAGPFALAADANRSYSAHDSLSGKMSFDIYWGCDNRTVNITIDGDVDLGSGTQEVAIIPASTKWSTDPSQQPLVKSYTADFTFELDEEIVKTKIPSQGGAGGNPYIWFQPDDTTDYYLLGRCVYASQMSLNHLDVDGIDDLIGTFDLTATSCSNKGSSLTVGVSDDLDGIHGQVIFTNQATIEAVHVAVAGGATLDVDYDATDATWRKGGGWKANGASGNPYVFVKGTTDDYDGHHRYTRADAALTAYLTFLAGEGLYDGDVDEEWTFIGRCSELKK